MAALVLLLMAPERATGPVLALLVLGRAGMTVHKLTRRLTGAATRSRLRRPRRHTDLLDTVLADSAGRGAYLGVDRRGQWRHAPAERAVLVLGPPRSGKTSGVMIPALLSHAGPAVSTSTKPEVRSATHPSRSRLGRVWVFDPTGTSRVSEGHRLRWSPVACSGSWDGALLMARAMIVGAGVGTGTTDHTH